MEWARLRGLARLGGRRGDGIAGGAAGGDPGFGRVADLVHRFLGRAAPGRAARQIATIRRLRHALNAGGEPDLLRTVRATGYALDHAAAARRAVG